MPETTKLQFTRQRITQLREFLLSNGQVQSITTDDGMSTTFDRSGAVAELKALEEQEQRLTGNRSWIRKVDMT
jgi:hypothetical protein